MLVLSRKVNESIVLHGDIRVVVIGIRGKQVRLGVVAPCTVDIIREELVVNPWDEGDDSRPRPKSKSKSKGGAATRPARRRSAAMAGGG